MKNILFTGICMLVMLWGCEKEGDVHPDINPADLYRIEDNASDSIQHRVYEIYKEYGVPVFFNDTIGKTFVKMDVYGDSVFVYERLDPAWGFTSYSNLDYQYTYMTDPDEKMQFLDMIESFLKTCSNTLYPYSVFVVNNYKTIGNNDATNMYSDGKYSIFYKLLLLTGDINTPLESKPEELIRSIIETRITDYIDLLSAFNRVSKSYVGANNWASLGVDQLSIPFEITYKNYWGQEETILVTKFTDYPMSGSTNCLNDDWWGYRDLSVEMVERTRKSIRFELGIFGFVGSSLKTTYLSVPPEDVNDDLKVFVKEVMRYSKQDFEKIWGTSPLVMQKYEILADIIENKLGVKL